MTADLVAFLRARADEAEHEANELNVEIIPGLTLWQSYWSEPTGLDGLVDYIDRYAAPPHLLAVVEAKRQIIEEHAIVHRDIGWLADDDGERVEEYAELPVCRICVPKHSHFGDRDSVPVGPCRTLRLLALPYADHPDYRR